MSTYTFRDCPRHDGKPTSGLRFELGQTWQSTLDADFSGAQVYMSWSASHLHISATLNDNDIHNDEKRHNARHFKVGDVFEIFIQVLNSPVYHEFHVTPDNAQLNLRFPSSEAFRNTPPGEHDVFLMPSTHGQLFTSAVSLDHAAHLWSIQAEIPFAVIGEGHPITKGCEMAVSFSRYDYIRGREKPIYSSSSPHKELRFHTIEDWARIRLV